MDFNRLARAIVPIDTILSLDEAKTHLNITHDDDDDLVTSLIEAVTAYIDGPQGIGVSLITQTWRLSLDRLPNCFRIPLCPVRSVTSIAYVDEGGTTQTLDPALYLVDLDASPALVARHPDATYPTTRHQPGAVKVTFVSGYGDTASDVPADLRQAAKLLLGHWYANRETLVANTLVEPPYAVTAILGKYRVIA